MTTYAEAYETIANRICESARFSAAMVALENKPFDTAIDEPWVRLTVLHFDSEQETLGRVGNRQFLRSGSVVVQVFVPYGMGVHRAQQIAQEVRDLYEGVSLRVIKMPDEPPVETMRFFAGSTLEIGLDGDFYQINVEVPFDYNEKK